MRKQVMPEEQKAALKDFLQRLLEVNPAKRMSVGEALSHPLLSLSL